MKAKLLLLIVVAILISGAAAAYKHWGNNHSSSEERIRVSGNIEATETQVAFKIAGRVESREVDEGMMVAAGRSIARLETADLEVNVTLRQAELNAAEAVLAKLKAGSRIEEIEDA